jgi:hypothetical protein
MQLLLEAFRSTPVFSDRNATVLLQFTEVGCFLAAATIAVLWVFDPTGSYEPGFTVASALGGGIELWRRFFANRSRGTVQAVDRPGSLTATILQSIDSSPLSVLLAQSLELVKGTANSSFEHWLRLELYGYTLVGGMTEADIVPEYREVVGQHRDARGRPVLFVSQLDFVNAHRFRFSVKQLEELAAETGSIIIRDSDAVEFIGSKFGRDVAGFEIHPSEVTAVLDWVRNIFREKLSQHVLVEEGKAVVR